MTDLTDEERGNLVVLVSEELADIRKTLDDDVWISAGTRNIYEQQIDHLTELRTKLAGR